MKILFLLSIALMFMTIIKAQEIVFEKGTFDDALEEAKANNKIVFMDCYTDWCGPCKMMTENVFTQKEVGELYNAQFVNVKINMEKGEGVELSKKYGIKAFPTLLFLDSDGKVLHMHVGALLADNLIEEGQKALDPNKRIDAIAVKYENGDHTAALVSSYITLLFDKKNKDQANEIGRLYLEGISGEDLLDDTNFSILSKVGMLYNGNHHLFVKSNKKRLSDVHGAEAINKLLLTANSTYLVRLAHTTNSAEAMDEAVKNFRTENADQDYSVMEGKAYKEFYVKNGMFESYFKLCDEIIAVAIQKNESGAVNEIIYSAYRVAIDPLFEDVEGANAWGIKTSMRAVHIVPANPTSYYLLAIFYKKLNNKAQALQNINLFLVKNEAQGGGPDPRVTKLKNEIEAM